MNDRVPYQPDTPQEQPAVIDPTGIDTGNVDDLTSLRIAELLEVLPEDRKDISNNLKELSNWAKESTKTDDPLLQLTAIKELRSKLGVNATGKKLIETLTKFTRLQLHKQSLDNETKRLKLEMNLLKNV